MKKLISIALILSFVFCLASCGSKKTDDIEIVKNEPNILSKNEVSSLRITDAENFSNGMAWIKYSTESGETYSLIDTSGKIVYTHYGKLEEVHNFTGNTAYTVEKTSNDHYIYRIIDKNGNEVISSESGAFDIILGYGDGKYFVYKYEGTINTSEDKFGVIDESGNYIKELKGTNGLKSRFSTRLNLSANYLGNGMFAISKNGHSDRKHFFIYDSDIGAFTMVIYNSFYLKNGEKTAIDKYVYFRACSDTEVFFATDFENNFGDGIEIGKELDGKDLRISNDGELEQTYIFDIAVNDTLIRNDYKNQTLYLIDPVTDRCSTLTNYTVKEIEPADENFLIELYGVDNCSYYTIIDRNCNMMFEPIKATYAKAGDGKIVVYKGNENFAIIDYSGNTVFETSEYDYISRFSNGIAWAKKEINDSTDYYYGIDEKGNVIFS